VVSQPLLVGSKCEYYSRALIDVRAQSNLLERIGRDVPKLFSPGYLSEVVVKS